MSGAPDPHDVARRIEFEMRSPIGSGPSRPDEADDNGLGFAAGVMSAFLLLAILIASGFVVGFLGRAFWLLLLAGWELL